MQESQRGRNSSLNNSQLQCLFLNDHEQILDSPARTLEET
jgi:hypothetical protein